MGAKTVADSVIKVNNTQELDVVVGGFPPASWARETEAFCVKLTSLFDVGGKRFVILVKVRNKTCKLG